ncbi:aldolase [Corynespora cassiicola Philippines]|uniref:Aldolase n=1 Tax=Corynespora cassiicola Philippines TaxID=1448308 RepID=A0A2T2P8P9_CORCC|nr:aldolase [Corynespora cassiicola Philippines]
MSQPITLLKWGTTVISLDCAVPCVLRIWLQKLNEELNIDADWMDSVFSKQMNDEYGVKATDMTGNTKWVNEEMLKSENTELFENSVRELKGKGWLAIYNRFAVNLAKMNMENIKGRVALQVNPHEAYDKEAILGNARAYATKFERVGIPKTRYFIQIPSTGPALNAAKILEEEGIRTLGTFVFSPEQAIACSQAKMLYISPYLNEVSAYNEPALGPGVAEDPATKHPMSPTIIKIIVTYKQFYAETGEEQPLVKIASLIFPEEGMAAGAMGCHSATFPADCIRDLAEVYYNAYDRPHDGTPKKEEYYKSATAIPKRLMQLVGDIPSFDKCKDYLAQNGALLDATIEKDSNIKRILNNALNLFRSQIGESRLKIEKAIVTL